MAKLPFLKLVQDELRRVEEVLLAEANVSYRPLAEGVAAIIKSGGKRLRPALAILASKFYPADEEKVILLAAGMEMLHTATLIHDDLIDNASTRRGIPTLNVRWPAAAVVLAGDHVFARAASLVARTGSPRVVRIFAEALKTICDGELRQIFGAFGWPQDLEDYYYRIHAKTAALFAAATGFGGVLSGAPERVIQALRTFGQKLGTAFQIVDDTLDFIGDRRNLGKPTGTDLRQGIVTLPVFLYVQDTGDEESVTRVFNSQGEEREKAIATLIEKVRNSQAIEETLSKAAEVAAEAKEAIGILPDNEYRRAMMAIADFAVERRV